MNPIDTLKKEHEDIERELFELESISQDKIINYPNLIYVIKNFCNIWDDHEQKEEKIFQIFEKEEIKVPVETMLCEHRDLRPHKNALKKAINSGSDFKVKQALDKNGKIIIEKIRKHINDEDEVLYRIVLEVFTKDELGEMYLAISDNG